jgi:hypothetical protein
MNTYQTEISFEQAKVISERQQVRNAIRFEEYMQEIKDSNPLALSASDFEYYAGQLNYYNPDKNKKYTSNDVRRMMMKDKDIDAFDMIQSFMDAEDDSIIDFF